MNSILDKRTKGEWDYGYGDNSKAFGIFTKKMLDEGLLEHPICLISPIETMNEVDKANAAFIVEAVNNHERLNEEVLMYAKDGAKWHNAYRDLKEENKDLLAALKELLHIHEDKTYGDTVWRLGQAIANAAYIVHCVNSYDKLVEQNKELLEALENLPKWLEQAAEALEAFSNKNGGTNALTPKLNWYANKIREATKAEQL